MNLSAALPLQFSLEVIGLAALAAILAAEARARRFVFVAALVPAVLAQVLHAGGVFFDSATNELIGWVIAVSTSVLVLPCAWRQRGRARLSGSMLLVAAGFLLAVLGPHTGPTEPLATVELLVHLVAGAGSVLLCSWAWRDSASSIRFRVLGAFGLVLVIVTVLAGSTVARVVLDASSPEVGCPAAALAQCAIRAVFLATLASSLFALVVAGWLAARLARPIQDLTASVRTTSPGQRAAIPTIRTDDEIGALAEALRTMTDELVLADTTKTTLLNRLVPHELRTIDQIISGNASTLRRRIHDDRLLALVDEIVIGAKRLGRRRDQLETTGIIRSRGLDLRTGRLKPADLVLKAVDQCLARHAVGARKRVRLDVPGSLPAMLGDEDKLVQALDEIIDNPFQWCHDSALSITIRATAVEGGVEFSISDNGPGIPDERMPTLFAPLTQVDANAHQGLHLGLFIAHAILEAHGSSLTVISRPGEGVTVGFTLRSAGPHAAEPTSETSLTTRSDRVLLGAGKR